MKAIFQWIMNKISWMVYRNYARSFKYEDYLNDHSLIPLSYDEWVEQ